ncbi:bifunctional fructose-bisphosphatase/inositol-phosphate phosphatase [Methanobacterium sp. ACI-7]|uniref:bifunctional fructose-bisphosphatase/inositol-phosphate phosphatase n=1 Tax=unclassified Methanobacterium TaxID=2627676 RepID=UPI0039C37730
MKEEEVKFWRKVSHQIIDEVEKTIQPLVGKKKSGEVVKMGADGTPTKLIDEVAEEKIIEILRKTGKSIIIVSEEIGKFKIGDEPHDVIFVVDPLDGTVNALKNIPAYGISIAIVDSSLKSFNELTLHDVEMGFVKNLATGDLYEAFKDKGAYLNNDKQKSSIEEDLTHASIGAYIRGAEMNRMDKLSHMVKRIRLLGAVAIELSYVADGTYDAFIDIRGNLRIVDIAAAKLIIEESGGIITDENGNELNNKLSVKERTSVIAACNLEIHNELMNVMGAF